MDGQEYTPIYTHVNELYIDTVVIDDTEFITLWCFTVLDDAYKFIYLGCDFTQFNQMLIASGDKGQEIALHLANTLNTPYDVPTLIPVKELFDEYLELTGYDLVMYKPIALEEDSVEYEDETETSLSDEFSNNSNKTKQKYLIYQLDNLYPSKVFEPDPMEPKTLAEHFEDDALELAQLYYNYLNAVENGYTEEEARQVAGLEKELFFRLACKAAELWK